MKKPTGIKPKHFVLNTGCYRQDIVCTINMRSKEIMKLFKKYNLKPLPEDYIKAIDEKQADTGLYFYHSNKQHRLICLFPSNYKNAIQVFDHEKMHLLADVMRHVDIPMMQETEEAWCYLSEHLMQQFLSKA